MLIKLLGEEHPDLIAVAFDKGPPTVRLEKYPEYKAGRGDAGRLPPQLGLIREVLETLRSRSSGRGHEADDALGTLAVRAAERGIDAVSSPPTATSSNWSARGSACCSTGGGSPTSSATTRRRRGAVRPPPRSTSTTWRSRATPPTTSPACRAWEKTAAKLIQEYGTSRSCSAPRVKREAKDNVAASPTQLTLNKELARIVTDLELDLEPEDC